MLVGCRDVCELFPFFLFQIAAILAMKCGGDLPVGIGNLRPDHHLDNQRLICKIVKSQFLHNLQ